MKFQHTLYLLLISLLFQQSCKVSDYASSSEPITHEIWDSLLQKHVSSDGLVNYKGFIQDSLLLNRYLNLLQNNHPNEAFWSSEQRLAYWINAYNAFTVKLITNHYPVESIKDIKNGIPFVNSVWDIKFIEIEDAVYDLNNIEHGIIRAKFKEPRIHFAVNCASISCPNLMNRAFVPDQLDEQLTIATKLFLTDQSKNQLNKEAIALSKIFSWYRFDFNKNDSSVIDFINQYGPIKIEENAKKSYLDYNWNLNEVVLQ